MRYNFSKKQIIKNSFIAFIYTFIICCFILACISQIYYNFWLEIIACLSVSLGVTAIFSVLSFLRHSRKQFSINEKELIFFINGKEVKRIEHKDLIEINIAKSIFKGNRVINLTTKEGNISFAVNFKVYQRIRGFFPIFNDKKEEGLIVFNGKYKLKTLAMRLCVLTFFFAVITLCVTPIMLGLLREVSDHYADAKKMYFLFLTISLCVLVATYLVYFFVKYFLYARHSIRFDGTLKVEYYKFGKQKCNFEIKTIEGIREVRSVFTRLFGIEQVYIIHKNTDDVIVNDLIPFCITKSDAEKLKKEIFKQQCDIISPSKKVYGFCAFPIILLSSLIIFLSVLFTPVFLCAFIGVGLYYTFYIKNRGYAVGDKILAFSCGSLSKTIYTFKCEYLKGFSATERFFERKMPYLSYEILIEGENGVYILGPYERGLAEKIKEKLKDNK